MARSGERPTLVFWAVSRGFCKSWESHYPRKVIAAIWSEVGEGSYADSWTEMNWSSKLNLTDRYSSKLS